MPRPSGPLATALAIDQHEIDRRIEAADLGPSRLAALARHRDPLQVAFATALDAFYPRLLTQPELASLLGKPGQLAQLRRSNEHYLAGLLTPTIDADYVESRLRVGATHHRLHVLPQAYLCSFAPLLDEPLRWLLGRGEFDAAMTLLDRALFDAGLALDAYGLRLEQELRRVEPAAAGPDAPFRAPEAAGMPSAPTSQRPQVRLSVEGVGGRRAFLDLGAERIDRLRELGPVIAAALPAVLEGFYRFFTTHERTAGLVPPHAVPQLQRQVAAYWREFATGDFDRPHAASRMRIGMVHERIGLSPQWYLAGLSRQVRGLLTAIATARPHDAGSCVSAFVHALCFDVSYVIDAYMESRAETVLRTEGYAARLIASLTAGVAVLDANQRIVSVNRSMLDLLGVDASLLQHMPITAALPLAELPPLLQQLAKAPQSRPSACGRHGARLLRLTAVRLDDGSGAGTALVVDDVTELERFGSSSTRARPTPWSTRCPTWCGRSNCRPGRWCR